MKHASSECIFSLCELKANIPTLNTILISAIRLEAEHQNFKSGIENFEKEKLSKAETVEKNTLPTKEVIEQEKKA